MEIERFVARRSLPGVIWSDIGNSSFAAKKELLKNILNWNQQALIDSFVKKTIKWRFKPPSPPHHGGVLEGLVRSFKHNF